MNVPSPTKKTTIAMVTSLVVAVGAAIPTVTELVNSLRLGVDYGESSRARDQQKAWETNFYCTRKADIQTFPSKYGIELGSVICPTGDVLIIGKKPDNLVPLFYWVRLSDIIGKEGIGLVASAFATGTLDTSDNTAIPQLVICQRWVNGKILIQRIQTSKGCYDITIDTYTGRVIGSRPATCNCSQF
jgi:hypothetical protein